MDVGGTAGVVTGEGCVKLHNPALVGLVDTTEEGIVKVGSVRAVTIAAGRDARVDTGGVAVPQLDVDRGNRLAGVDINDLDVEVQRYTFLILGNVLTDQLALDPIGSLSYIWRKDAGVVAGEEDGGIGISGDPSQVGGVGGAKDSVKIASAKIVLLCILR